MSKKGKLVIKKSFLELLLQWGIIGLFLILPLLYFSGRAASYVTSKQYFFIGTVDLLLVLWAWLLLSDSRYRLTGKNLLWISPIFLFLISMTISAFKGVDTATSFFSTVETGTGLILLYHVFIFTCILSSFLRVQQKQFLNKIFQAILFSSVILSVATFFTGENGLFDIHSEMLNKSVGGAMMGNSLLAGAVLLFGIFFGILLLIQESKLWKKILYSLGLIVVIISPVFLNVALFKGENLSSVLMLLGGARVAAACLGIGLVICLAIWLCTRRGKIYQQAIGAGMILAVLLTGGVVTQKLSDSNSSLHSYFMKESGNRVVDWQASIQGIKDKPLLGWGSENFHVVYQKYLDPIVFSPGHGDEVWALHPHNNTLEVLINGGIIGGIFYLIVIIGLFVGLFNLYRTHKIDAKTFSVITGLLIAFIIQQQMVYESIISYIMFFLIIGIITGLSDTIDESRKVYVNGTTATYAIGAGILVVMVPVWLYAAYMPARKMEELQRMATLPSDVRTNLYEHLFHSSGSYAINTDAEFFIDPLFYSYDAQKEQLKANPTYQKVASIELKALFTAVEPVWRNNPDSYHLTLSLANLKNLQFYLTDDKQQLLDAGEYIKHGKDLSATDPQIYTLSAQTYMRKGDNQKALEEVNKAIALNPAYQPAQSLLKDLKGNNL